MWQRKNKIKAGFTLIEIMIAVAIFSTVVVIALSIFLNSQGLQQRTLAIQRGQSDARFALEMMARSMRLGEIDYEYYDQISSLPLDPIEHELALRNSAGEPERYRLFINNDHGYIQMCSNFSQENLNDRQNTNQSELCEPEAAWINITPDNIDVNRLDFYITPLLDPYKLITDDNNPNKGEYYGGDQQEMVTIVLESDVEQNTGGDYPAHFQTTVSSRVYKR